jgi:phosphoribosyl 1,2-cyclic phosphodiesterase
MDSTAIAAPADKPLRIRSLASGSSGNAYLVEAGDQLLLLDCGVGIRQIQSALALWGRSASELTGVIISHEHSDHVRALPSFSGLRTQFFATRGTSAALGLVSGRTTALAYQTPLQFGSLTITPIQTSHDAAEPCGLLVESESGVIGLVTDLGTINDEICAVAAKCDLLILESNHDRDMLRSGPYPAHLKRRVASDVGHLSNDQASGLLYEVSSDSSGPSEVWLAHLSATNNTPSAAKAAVQGRFAQSQIAPTISVLPRGGPGPTWDSTRRRLRQIQLVLEF